MFDLAYFQTIGMMKEEVFAAVPLFIFMGFITEQAGLMERLFNAFRNVLAPVRGSLFTVVIVTATVFAMATGIVGASVTVLGIMAAPIMIKTGYDAKLSAGAITAGGTLGILIPPSVMLIVMGPVLGVSVGDLYAAAFGPGFLLAGIYVVYLLGRSFLDPARAAGAARRAGPASRSLLREVAVGVVPLACAHRRHARLHSGGRRHADRGIGGRRAGRDPARRRLRKAYLCRPEAGGAFDDDDLEHGAAPRGHLQHLRRGVLAARHRRPGSRATCSRCRCRRWRCWWS